MFIPTLTWRECEKLRNVPPAIRNGYIWIQRKKRSRPLRQNIWFCIQ